MQEAYFLLTFTLLVICTKNVLCQGLGVYHVIIAPGSDPRVQGQLTVAQVNQGITIRGQITGLAPGPHGFHIHEKGVLTNACKDAGPHFNPFQKSHGHPRDEHRHVGDLGNIEADSTGVALIDILDSLASLNPSSPTFIGHRAIVVHAKPDDVGRGGDEESKKTGNAGARVGCGILAPGIFSNNVQTNFQQQSFQQQFSRKPVPQGSSFQEQGLQQHFPQQTTFQEQGSQQPSSQQHFPQQSAFQGSSFQEQDSQQSSFQQHSSQQPAFQGSSFQEQDSQQPSFQQHSPQQPAFQEQGFQQPSFQQHSAFQGSSFQEQGSQQPSFQQHSPQQSASQGPTFQRPLLQQQSDSSGFSANFQPFDERIPTSPTRNNPLLENVANVRIVPGSGIAVRGNLKLQEVPGGVTIKGFISGLTPGPHGFHIHEKGDLGDQCKNALGHFNPFKLDHGDPTDPERHVGDLGNIIADSSGVAHIDIYDPLASFNHRSQAFIGDRAIVVHAKPDDLGRGGDAESLKTGNAGARVGCGVIRINDAIVFPIAERPRPNFHQQRRNRQTEFQPFRF